MNLSGNEFKDPVTGTGRRIDFVVTKDNQIVDSIEVTSYTADKTAQIAKENRIIEAGGCYIKDNHGTLIPLKPNMTRVERVA